MSVVNENAAVSKPGTVVSRTGGTTSTSSTATSAPACCSISRLDGLVRTDRAEHDLGLGGRRNDVRRDAALDQADGVERPARDPDRRPVDGAKGDERVDELVDRRHAELRQARVRRAARRAQPRAIDAARRGGEPVVGRLAVDQEARSGRDDVRGRRAVAAPLLADDEQQADARLAGGAQPLGRRDLRDERALGVAGSAPVQAPVRLAARKERRHAVEVRGEHDVGIARPSAMTLNRPSTTGCSVTS